MAQKVAIIEVFFRIFATHSGLMPSFARHIAHILPNYHTERISRANTNHREVQFWWRLSHK